MGDTRRVADVLDDMVRLSELDERGMLNILGRFDQQLEEAVGIGESASLAIDGKSIRTVLVSGLGGSAIGADFIRAYLGKAMRVPLWVNRGYSMPGFVDKNCLVVLSSYSGNTEETISSFEEARAAGARLLCICSGGQIERMAEESGTPCIRIPQGYPREQRWVIRLFQPSSRWGGWALRRKGSPMCAVLSPGSATGSSCWDRNAPS